jgi:hypothetical protein
MRYQVPQFIDVEDKIVGPFSIKQFLYLAGGAAGVYLSFAWLPVFLGIFPAAILGGLGVCLAFVRVNNRPFIDLVDSSVHFFVTPRLYVWRRTEKKSSPEIEISTLHTTKKVTGPAPMTHATGNSLATLEWQIDTHDKAELAVERGTTPQAKI